MSTAKITDELIRLLGTISTRNEAGSHFTEWADYEPLEDLGLIVVNRPIHASTGIHYSLEYWSVEITDEGQSLVDCNPELF
jgi:hypothetical protein